MHLRSISSTGSALINIGAWSAVLSCWSRTKAKRTKKNSSNHKNYHCVAKPLLTLHPLLWKAMLGSCLRPTVDVTFIADAFWCLPEDHESLTLQLPSANSKHWSFLNGFVVVCGLVFQYSRFDAAQCSRHWAAEGPFWPWAAQDLNDMAASMASALPGIIDVPLSFRSSLMGYLLSRCR